MDLIDEDTIFIFCFLFNFFLFCSTTQSIDIRYVTYNLEDEGYLDSSHLQTIAHVQASRRNCLSQAKKIASQKMLSIFLHTKFSVPPASRLTVGDTFTTDYPILWTKTDYDKAKLEFAFLFDKIFVLIADARNNNRCSVVLRLQYKNIAKSIRNHKLTYIDSSIYSRIKANQR